MNQNSNREFANCRIQSVATNTDPQNKKNKEWGQLQQTVHKWKLRLQRIMTMPGHAHIFIFL